MQRFLSLLSLLWLVGPAMGATTVTSSIPISQMPITTNIVDTAYFPLIQPFPGRTTNDNFRASWATMKAGLTNSGGGSGESLWMLSGTMLTPTNSLPQTGLFNIATNGSTYIGTPDDPVWGLDVYTLKASAPDDYATVVATSWNGDESLTAQAYITSFPGVSSADFTASDNLNGVYAEMYWGLDSGNPGTSLLSMMGTLNTGDPATDGRAVWYPWLTNGVINFDFQSPPRLAGETLFRIGNSSTTMLALQTESGWTGAGTNAFLDDGTFGPVAVINPTDNFLPYRISAYELGDSPWFIIATNKLGFLGSGSTNQFFYGGDDFGNNLGIGISTLEDLNPGDFPSYNTAFGNEAGKNISSGSWNTLMGQRTGWLITSGENNSYFGFNAGAATTTGSGNSGFGSTALLANQRGYNNAVFGVSAGVYVGLGGTGVPEYNSIFGTAAGTHIYGSGTDGGVTNGNYNTLLGGYATTLTDITNAIGIGFQATVTNNNEIVIGNPSNTKLIVPITSWTGAGTQVLTDDGTYKSVSAAGGLSINPTDNYLPFRTNSTTFLNSPIYVVSTNIALNTQFLFGPGTTNMLSRSGNDLVYTNGGSTVDFKVVNGSGKHAVLEANSDNSARLTSPDSYVALVNTGGNLVRLNGAFWEPGTSAAISLGGPSSGNWWNEAGFTDTYFDAGHNGTNYSRGRIVGSAGGGSPDIRYDSQAAGTNNYATQSFTVGATNMLRIDSNAGASTTGILIYENGSSRRVTIGANDSGGAGFRVLRVPN